MEVPLTEAFRQRARRGYERGRAVHALLAAAPLVAIVVLAGLIADAWFPAIGVGPVVYVTAVVCALRGRDLGRAVLPGAIASVVPFLALHSTRLLSPDCTGGRCRSYCVPACLVGGAIAGFGLGAVTRRLASPMFAAAIGTIVAVLVGSLGCPCVGAAEILVLFSGLVVGAVPLTLGPHRHVPRG